MSTVKIGSKLRQCSCGYRGTDHELNSFVYKVVGESSRYWKLEGGGSVSKTTMQFYGCDSIYFTLEEEDTEEQYMSQLEAKCTYKCVECNKKFDPVSNRKISKHIAYGHNMYMGIATDEAYVCPYCGHYNGCSSELGKW